MAARAKEVEGSVSGWVCMGCAWCTCSVAAQVCRLMQNAERTEQSRAKSRQWPVSAGPTRLHTHAASSQRRAPSSSSSSGYKPGRGRNKTLVDPQAGGWGLAPQAVWEWGAFDARLNKAKVARGLCLSVCLPIKFCPSIRFCRLRANQAEGIEGRLSPNT